MQLGLLKSELRGVPCPSGPLGPKGKYPETGGDFGRAPGALDPFPGERAGELVDHHVGTADQPGLAGFVSRKLHRLMHLHLNGLTL